MKKICFIAQFPPPIHGLSKAVDTLYNSELSKEFQFEKIDIKNNKKFLKSLLLIFNSRADLFYFTISQSKGGNLRDLIILKMLELQQKKCLIHLHGGYYRTLVDSDLPKWQKEANYKAISKLSGAIVLSESLKANFTGMLPNEKIFVIPNCVEDDFLLSEEETRNKIKRSKEKRIKNILYFSNLLRDKGYHKVLELAKFEKDRCECGEDKKFHFDFAGKFFEESEEIFFWNYIKENELQEYVTYHGLLSGTEKARILKESDIYILLSNNEGQPLSMLEAMANAMVIVTTYCGGIPDIVKENENAIICKKNETIDKLYESLCEFNSFSNFSKNNYVLCVKNYTQEMYIDNMKKVFEITG